MNREIQELAKVRAIPILLHFTKAANLESIMQHGIVPVGLTAGLGIAALINDTYRLDQQPNATCVSIGFPNNRMFYKYRQADESIDWAVLGIKPDVLWQKPCAFCQRNAADALVTAIPLQQRMTVAAFSGMFENIDGEPSNARAG